jgi:hypothetical protein
MQVGAAFDYRVIAQRHAIPLRYETCLKRALEVGRRQMAGQTGSPLLSISDDVPKHSQVDSSLSPQLPLNRKNDQHCDFIIAAASAWEASTLV